MLTLSNKIIHIKTLLPLVNASILSTTKTWCKIPISDHFLNADNYILFRSNRYYGIGGGTTIIVPQNIQACKFGNERIDAIDDST